MNRCSWCNQNNPIYIKYHDEEWGILRTDDPYLFEMLVLESFQAGLSWECVLNKREAFRNAYDHFELEKVILYDEKKIEELTQNEGIIRNRLKIKASIKNAKVFQSIIKEYGSFYTYLKSFTKGKIYYEIGKTTNKLSDQISLDLKKRKMSFVGSTIIYSYLQAIGIINSHERNCFLYHQKESKSSLISLEMIASSYDEEISSYFIKDYKMIITYKEKPKEEVQLKEEDYQRIESLFQKYNVLKWKDLDKNDLEFIDGEDTQVYYEFERDIKGHVSIQECMKEGSSFFHELESVLKQITKHE